MKFLKKSQVIISIVALMLITAGYFNYIENIDITQTMSNSIIDNILHEENHAHNEDNTVNEEEFAAIGDAKLVDADVETEVKEDYKDMQNDEVGEAKDVSNNESADNYFTASRLERNTMYSEMISTYEKMIENPNVSETQKGIATNEIYKINSTKNAIMICENLIKNKGFFDVVVFSNNNSINVVVKAESLDNQQIAQIQNIISRELNAEVQKIHISCK
jgi:hypothetical protein